MIFYTIPYLKEPLRAALRMGKIKEELDTIIAFESMDDKKQIDDDEVLDKVRALRKEVSELHHKLKK